MTLSKRMVIFLDWWEVLKCIEEKYGLTARNELEDIWDDWTEGTDCSFFSVDEETLYHPDWEWMSIIAKTLYDNGIGMNEEVYIYADE